MKINSVTRWTALLALLVWSLAAASGAAAQGTGTTLPETKEPKSARFDITGSLTASGGGLSRPATIGITGSGAMSGSSTLQEDITISLPLDAIAPGSGNAGSGNVVSVTVSVILIDGKLYQRTSGLTPESEGKWYVSNLSGAGASASSIFPGISSTGALDPKLAPAFTTTVEGKEMIGGAPTTRYRINVDLKKLSSATGGSSPAPGGIEVSGDTRLTLYMWVGDNDMYAHQVRMALDSVTPASGGVPAGTAHMEITLTFKEFDVPVTITAPANAVPLDISSDQLASLFGGMPVSSGPFAGMPSTAGMMSGMHGTVGMPVAGQGRTGSEWSPLLAALGLAGIAAGAAMRRRASVPGR